MKIKKHAGLATALAIMSAALLATAAQADTGKLLLTGGISSVEGAAGGGLTPWATVGTNATDGETGGSVFFSTVGTRDYGLRVIGAAVGFNDHFELSVASQDFDTRGTGIALGLPGLHLKQTVVGAKLRVFGDAVLDSDTLMPQIAIGVQHKMLASTGLDATLNALGAKRSGTDFYISATKLFLGTGVLLNGTLRATKGNQGGLLGHGAIGAGDESRYSLQPELSIGYLISKNLIVGAEYRFMRNKLTNAGAAAGLGDGLRSQDWKDIFIAWAPNKDVSLTLAYVDLGVIVPFTTVGRKQSGYYLSAQLAF